MNIQERELSFVLKIDKLVRYLEVSIMFIGIVILQSS